MIQTKFRVFFSTFAALAVAFGTLALADEHGPLHEMMESVNKANNAINKAVRTPVNYKKDAKTVTEKSKELVKLAKDTVAAVGESKKIKGVKGDPEAQWKTLAADFLKSSEELAKVAGKEDHAATKNAHQAVKKSCSGCHEVFRVEDEK